MKVHTGNTLERLAHIIHTNCRHNSSPSPLRTVVGSVAVIEMFVRLGLALTLSLGLAVLLAWGWDRSDPPRSEAPRLVEVSSNTVVQ